MSKKQDTTASNFDFLAEHDELLAKLGAAAEQVFYSDPNATLMKLRQLGEAMAQHIAARSGIEFDEQTTQADLLYRLGRELRLDQDVKSLFHSLRVEGNRATHEFHTRHKEALDGLKLARTLAVWFHRSFGRQGSAFKPGPFTPPADPSAPLQALSNEVEKLRLEIEQRNEALASSQQLADAIAKEKSEYEALALAMDEENRQHASEIAQHEQALARQREEYERKLREQREKLTAEGNDTLKAQKETVSQQVERASRQLVLSEEETRILIDQQLADAGWEADTDALCHSQNARPQKGRNRAIAEYPTGDGRADYVLFSGLTPLAVVEAKKENTNVAGKLSQAERYSRGLRIAPPLTGAWKIEQRNEAWPDGSGAHFHIPFVYSCNGRDYVAQIAEQSGTWFRDVRQASNTSRALDSFHTPEGLLDLLKRSREMAEAHLQKEPFGYLKLRPYQEAAIRATEASLSQGQRGILLAMATGTGKTHTIKGLMYRLLKAERFRRILFLVDRRTLGTQATDAFKETPLEQNLTLSASYNIAELGDMAAEAATRIQVATVQAMVKRVMMSDDPPSVDTYDCIIIDEAHRGYTLDQEMTEGELALRDAEQYQSSYRRVLDYFDAVRIALTATPAKHTSEIFGKPVYTYSYREAVADDWLIDHEPPIRYETLLTQNGIQFDSGDEVHVVNTQTGAVETAELEDDLDFKVEAFNRRVINENFNRVICEQLARELDPFGEEKTLIFCANDRHADMVKRLLDEAFKADYDDDYNQDAVAKITGQSDKVDKLIARYKNERYPNIGITVDLLTTGIDVPRICNLVFMRRVRSRILYEQMIGRATRRCDDIGKTVFRIYDPVDIYAALDDVNTMKPLAKDPNVSMAQLMDELTDPDKLAQALDAPGDQAGDTHADVVLSQLGQKLMRVLRKAQNKAEQKPEVRAKLDELERSWGIEPVTLPQHLRQLGPQKAAEFLQQQSALLTQLQDVKLLLGSEHLPIISAHDDEIRERSQSYGDFQRPEDYLDSFTRFVNENINRSVALGVVVNRPRDLTREQLKEVRTLLDGAGYAESTLQTAWRNQTNQDIAASIVGHIRRAAMGEALVPFEQRVAAAMQTLYSRHNWTTNQRKWLDRLGKQLAHEVIVDREFVNKRFADTGGANRFDKVLDNQLDTVLDELSEALWQVPA